MKVKDQSYKLDKVEVHEFLLYPRPKSASDEKLELNYHLNITSKVIVEKKIIVQQINIDIDTLIPKESLAAIKILIGYIVDPFDDFVKLDKAQKLYVIDPKLEGLIRNISIGTSRGILLTRLQGTYLSDAILPIVHNAKINSGISPNTD